MKKKLKMTCSVLCLVASLLLGWLGYKIYAGREENQAPHPVVASLLVLYDVAHFVDRTVMYNALEALRLEDQSVPILMNADIAFSLMAMNQFSFDQGCLSLSDEEFLRTYASGANRAYLKKMADEREFAKTTIMREAERLMYYLVHLEPENIMMRRALVCRLNALKDAVYRTIANNDTLWHGSYYRDLFESVFDEAEIHFNPREWHTYIFPAPCAYENAQPLVLFIPRLYSENMRTKAGWAAGVDDDTVLGFNLAHGVAVEPDQLADTLADIVRKQKASNSQDDAVPGTHALFPIAASITSIFKPYDSTKPIAWNIFFAGHGSARSESTKTPITAALRSTVSKQESYMVGMPTSDFMHILDYLSNARARPLVAILVWGTCYGGGHHARAIEQQTTLAQLISKREAIGALTPEQLVQIKKSIEDPVVIERIQKQLLQPEQSYIAVSLVPTDTVASFNIAAAGDFFEQLKEIAQEIIARFNQTELMNARVAHEIYDSIHHRLIRAVQLLMQGAYDDPIIMFPTAHAAFRTSSSLNM